MEPKAQTIEAVVFLSSRMQIREAVRESVKKFSPGSPVEFHSSSEIQSALAAAEKSDNCLLILDWEFGKTEISKILKQLCGGSKRATRPILLLAKSISDELIATGYEYQVSKVHTGDISVSKIVDLLKEISADELYNLPLKSIMLKVNRKRKEGRWDVASEILQNLDTRVPDNPKIIVELARNKIQEDLWDEALSLLEPLVDLNPPNIRALQMLSRCQLKRRKFNDAKDTLKKAKLVNPFNVERLIMLGNVLLECRETGEAKNIFKEAGALSPQNKEAKKGEGKCLLLEGEVNEALALLRDLDSQQELASVFNSSAVLTMRQGNHQAGISLYNSALDLSENTNQIRARLLFNKGVGYRRWNRDPDAINCFKEAMDMDGSFVKAKRSHELLTQKSPSGSLASAGSRPQALQSKIEPLTPDHTPIGNQGFDDTIGMDKDNSPGDSIDEFSSDDFDDDFDDDTSLDFL